MKNQHANQNSLLIYRRRMGFSRKQVVQLLGHSNTSMLCRYENGQSMPPLHTALRLEIIYRAPVAFLYERMYSAIREEIRTSEARLRLTLQPTLF